MRPKTCGECEHFQKVEVYKFSGICKLQIKPDIMGQALRLLLGTCPPPGDECPLPADPAPDKINSEFTETMLKFKERIAAATAAPKRTETFEAYIIRTMGGQLLNVGGVPVLYYEPGLLKASADSIGGTIVRVRVTVEEI